MGTPLEIHERRDPKGLYKKAYASEEPLEASVERVLGWLKDKGYLVV